ncbi:conjugal transfer protein TraF [Shewanella intestini]|uniref:Conjugal transfer protein TraF n=1 Tax=Shewanella intestini TaxID=2017544 RepID=A0ABS5I331_9GAMM|nr:MULTISPECIES: conjugal transfer protein TraF [Shewanella]MBR9728443.1 conjugal transfer protein TraF [Shewanella intestini]MRG36785.1 hypothetical protein [Shewanella sp. XMDDZSB0408]
MLNRNTTRTLMALPLCISSVLAVSAQANATAFDSRAFAMGGVGVSSANYLSASFHNPALVARFNQDDGVGLLFPSIGVDANDPEDLIKHVEDFSDIYDEFKQISQPTAADAQLIIDQLTLIQGNSAQVKAGTQFAVAIPNHTLAINIFVQGYADGFVFADIADDDLDINNIINQDLSSQALTMGVVISEFGVSLAKSYKLANAEIFYGVSPKYQNVQTINYISDIENYQFDDWDDDKYQSDDSNMNVDVGFAYQHQGGYGIGFVGKNLISNRYNTQLINGVQAQYQINPTYTVSANYHNDFIVAAIDVQLNESEGYQSLTGTTNAFDTENDNHQMAAVGIELFPQSWVKFRAGYQKDLTDNTDDSITAGFGFSPFNVFHFDLSARYADNNNFGAAIQTRFTF